MKQNKITAFITSACLVGGIAVAQDNDKVEIKEKGSPPTESRSETGRSTIDKVQQGAKNIFAELKLEDLPQAVQKTVREQSRGAKIADIDREDRTGRTIYEVEFETEGKNREIHIAADGTMLNAEQASLQLGYDKDDDDADRTRVRERDDKNLKFTDLPAAVQATVKQHGSENQIADIDTYRRGGKRIYEVEFRRDGLNPEIHVSEDGKLIDNDGVGAPATDTPSSQGSFERPAGGGTVQDTLPPREVK